MIGTEPLLELGLSHGEAKIYVTLLTLGSTKVGSIIEKTGMASSAVHNALNTLIDKGLITYIKEGKVKWYQGIDPKQLVNYAEDRKRKIVEILPELEALRKFDEDREEAEIFRGIKGIMTMMNILLDDVKERDEMFFFAINVEERNEEVQDFFRTYDAKRAERGIIVRGLAPIGLRRLFKDRKAIEMKYCSFPIPANITACNGKVALYAWHEKPVGYLIISKSIESMFSTLFHSIWESVT